MISPEQPQEERGQSFLIGEAFYRPQGRLARDLGVLAASVYRAKHGQLRILETMSASGIRALRYAHEAQADWLWVNDANPDLSPTLRQNLQQLDAERYRLTCAGASHVLSRCFLEQDFYDLVDIDAFGSAGTFFSGAIGAVKKEGLIYLTATDGLTLCGHNPDLSLRRYGSYARAHPSSQEQGLRILIGRLFQQATARGFGLQPIFSLFTGQGFRVMVQLQRRATLASDRYGFLGYCQHCLDYQVVSWRQLGHVFCPHHSPPQSCTLTGPMWLGPLHQRDWLQQMLIQAQSWMWQDCRTILMLMAAEATLPPYHYTLGTIGRQGKIDPPNREKLLGALRQAGYMATRTHWNPAAIKTTANLRTCLELAGNVQEHP